MKRLLLTTILLMLFAANSNASNATQAILKLDTKGHTGLIKDIIITKSGELISASVDKTIRVWDIKSGKEKRKILGEIGAGSEGMIYAIALSSDERYLAVGGFRAAVLGHLERGPEAKTALDRYLALRPNLKTRDDYRRIFVPNSALADPIIEGLVKAGWEPDE